MNEGIPVLKAPKIKEFLSETLENIEFDQIKAGMYEGQNIKGKIEISKK